MEWGRSLRIDEVDVGSGRKDTLGPYLDDGANFVDVPESRGSGGI